MYPVMQASYRLHRRYGHTVRSEEPEWRKETSPKNMNQQLRHQGSRTRGIHPENPDSSQLPAKSNMVQCHRRGVSHWIMRNPQNFKECWRTDISLDSQEQAWHPQCRAALVKKQVLFQTTDCWMCLCCVKGRHGYIKLGGQVESLEYRRIPGTDCLAKFS